ncbi:MAG: single-stranded DNA-binding protein [Candidatus Izemoplasmatales bacterium]|nr:single-stranded DNA-binding protein [Candidatus Izemoplasmatales bacterium]
MLNKVVLIGRLVRDPELRYTTNSNIPVVTFTIAVNRPYSSQNESGERSNNNADFISCTAWRNQAENVSKYMTKGSMVAVDGRLQTRDYVDNNNVRRYVTEVVCDQVVFLETRAQRENYGGGNNDNYAPKENNDRNQNRREEDDRKNINIIEDDLPF